MLQLPYLPEISTCLPVLQKVSASFVLSSYPTVHFIQPTKYICLGCYQKIEDFTGSCMCKLARYFLLIWEFSLNSRSFLFLQVRTCDFHPEKTHREIGVCTTKILQNQNIPNDTPNNCSCGAKMTINQRDLEKYYRGGNLHKFQIWDSCQATFWWIRYTPNKNVRFLQLVHEVAALKTQ